MPGGKARAGRGGAWTVALHEVRRSTAFLNRRTVPLLVLVLASIAFLGPQVAPRLDAQRGLYPVALTAGSPFGPVVASDSRFTVVEGRYADLGDTLALWIDTVPHAAAGDVRGEAAMQALRQATQRFLDERLGHEKDQAAAFPVLVNVLAAPRSAFATPPGNGGDLVVNGTSSSTAQPTGAATPSAPAPASASPDPVLDAAPPESRTLAVKPRDVNPPFPVRSLLLTFAFLIPMNLIGQLHAGSLMQERLRHRTVLLLASPLSGGQVLLGRTLPYLGLALLAWAIACLAVGVGWVGAVAALLIVLFVLATSLILGLLARSPRELTFLLTGATTGLSTFLFLPAIFTAIPQVAFLSPVAVVSASIEGKAVGLGPFLYATLPLALVAVALVLLSGGLMRDETLHGQAGLGARVLASLRRLAASRRGLLVAGILAVPFALALQLFLLALIIPLGLLVALPAVILGAALVEEALKQAAVVAHRTGTKARPAWLSGLLVGTGFFLGEKLALLVGLVGFGLLPSGESAVAVLGGGTGLLLIAPLALHGVAAMVGAAGTTRGRGWSLLSLAGAWAIHCAYNAAILSGVLA
jgi:ABC-type Na+ efflux pump permease subunit